MPAHNYDVFISYRRQGGDAQALFIREKLLQHNVRVFLDVTDLKKGYFDEELLARIAEAPNFLVILSPNSLDRCTDEGDWLRQEIAQAVKTNRNIIPVMMVGFSFPRELPADMQDIRRHQGVEYSHVYSEGLLARILESIEADRAERDRLEKEKEKAARREQEKIEAKRRASERAEADRIAREKAERERRAQEKEERLAKEKASEAAQQRLAREKAEADSRAKEAEAQRQVGKSPEVGRRTVPAAVVPAAPPITMPAASRKSRWGLVPGGAVVLLVTTIIYLRSNSSNQKPPVPIAQTASNQSASGAAPGRGLQPVSGQTPSGNLPATQQGTSAPPSVPAPGTAARAPLPSLAQQMVAAAEIFTDARTGLMWTRKDNGSDLSWDSASQYCAQLSLGGYTGWRLPTTEELTGIYDGQNVSGNYRFGNEMLPLHTINGIHLSNYVIWSGAGDAAGFFRFNDGQHFRVRRENLKSAGAFPALCVRSSVTGGSS